MHANLSLDYELTKEIIKKLSKAKYSKGFYTLRHQQAVSHTAVK